VEAFQEEFRIFKNMKEKEIHMLRQFKNNNLLEFEVTQEDMRSRCSGYYHE
jgi:hypothetical protein